MRAVWRSSSAGGARCRLLPHEGYVASAQAAVGEWLAVGSMRAVEDALPGRRGRRDVVPLDLAAEGNAEALEVGQEVIGGRG